MRPYFIKWKEYIIIEKRDQFSKKRRVSFKEALLKSKTIDIENPTEKDIKRIEELNKEKEDKKPKEDNIIEKPISETSEINKEDLKEKTEINKNENENKDNIIKDEIGKLPEIKDNEIEKDRKTV